MSNKDQKSCTKQFDSLLLLEALHAKTIKNFANILSSYNKRLEAIGPLSSSEEIRKALNHSKIPLPLDQRNIATALLQIKLAINYLEKSSHRPHQDPESIAEFLSRMFHSLHIAGINAGRAINVDELKREARKEASQKALNSRYAERNNLLEKAVKIAKKKWEEGSTKKHHEMKKFLVEEYKEKGDIAFPFSGGEISDKALLKALRETLREMGRTDLIKGI